MNPKVPYEPAEHALEGSLCHKFRRDRPLRRANRAGFYPMVRALANAPFFCRQGEGREFSEDVRGAGGRQSARRRAVALRRAVPTGYEDEVVGTSG